MRERSHIEVLRRLTPYNEWWVSGHVPERLIKKFRRRDFYKVKENLSKNKITILIGPRRVGKTVLITQLIEDFMDKGIPPKNLLYAKLDDYLLKTASEANLEKILDIYSQNVLGTPITKLKKPIYVFFDEIHKISGWRQQLKDLFDLEYNIIFLVSGSSSPAMFKDDKGILTGRYRKQIMLPMKFVDVINLHERKHNEITIYNRIGLELRASLKNAIKTGKIKNFYSDLKRAFVDLSLNEKQIEIYLKEYLIKGGYPELYDKDKNLDWEACSDLLINQLDSILTRDIIEVFNVRNPGKVLDLFQLIGSQTAQIRKYTDMTQKLGIPKTDTLKNYLSYLNQTYLIGIAELFSNNIDTTKKSNKKLYVMDVGLRNISLGLMHPKHIEESDDLGKVVETAVFDHCSRLRFNLNKSISVKPLYYWKSNGYDVDIIIPTKNKPIPIEVKWRQKTKIKSILKFMKQYNAPFGIHISKNRLDLRDNVVYIPVWLFLIIC